MVLSTESTKLMFYAECLMRVFEKVYVIDMVGNEVECHYSCDTKTQVFCFRLLTYENVKWIYNSITMIQQHLEINAINLRTADL